MRGVGYDAEEARILVDHVLDAALCGYEYSGLAKLRLVRETGVSALFDGGNQSGMIGMWGRLLVTIGLLTKEEARGSPYAKPWGKGRDLF
jgi:hypothetical protein